MTDEQMSRRKHAGTTVKPQPRAKALPRSGLQKNRATSPRDTMGPYAIPIIIGIHHALKAEGHRMTVLAALISAHDLSTPFRTPMNGYAAIFSRANSGVGALATRRLAISQY